MNEDPFKEYIKETEPTKRDKCSAWRTAIGLQAVDGLKTSEYLKQIAVSNIEGDITYEEANTLLEKYYKENAIHNDTSRTEEADKVSLRITQLLSERTFSFSPREYLSIHRRLFNGIYSHAGSIRDYNITKREWVLGGESVLYGSASEIWATLEYDFSVEENFSYKNLSTDEIIHHLAIFVSRLWQIHAFCEGNTRTTAVFFIKYLRKIGFDVNNDLFEKNAWYFRNSLVRANYSDFKNDVHETTEFLEWFLRNLLLKEKNPLRNRALHISGYFKNKKVDIDTSKVDIGGSKVDIGGSKVDIGGSKVDIDTSKVDIDKNYKTKTMEHILALRNVFSNEIIFGRSDVMNAISIKASRASLLIKEMLKLKIIESVSGYGKGKYRFL